MQAGDRRIRPRPEFIPPGRKYGMCGMLPNCKKGDQCTFAHSEAEMRAWNEELAMTRSTDSEHVPTRVTCRPMPKGFKPPKGEFIRCSNFPDCKEGEACTFPHSEEERYEWNRQLRMELNIRKRPTRIPYGGKFKLCANLPNCPKGEFCTFAHSEAEEHAWNKELAGDSTDSESKIQASGVTVTVSKMGGKSISTDVASDFQELLINFCRDANHKGFDGNGSVVIKEEFMRLLKKHAENVERFNNIEKVELVKEDMIFKDVKIDIQHAKVIGEIRQYDCNEVPIRDSYQVLSNKTGDVEKTMLYTLKIRQAEGVVEVVTKFKQWTLSGAFTAQYDGLGTQLGISHTQGKIKTNIQSSKTEVEKEFTQDVQVPAKTEYRVCVINEFLWYECDLENVRLSTSKKSLEMACKVILSNGDTKNRTYKLQEVFGNCRVRDSSLDNDFVYELKGKYRWILLQRRIKPDVIP